MQHLRTFAEVSRESTHKSQFYTPDLGLHSSRLRRSRAKRNLVWEQIEMESSGKHFNVQIEKMRFNK